MPSGPWNATCVGAGYSTQRPSASLELRGRKRTRTVVVEVVGGGGAGTAAAAAPPPPTAAGAGVAEGACCMLMGALVSRRRAGGGALAAGGAGPRSKAEAAARGGRGVAAHTAVRVSCVLSYRDVLCSYAAAATSCTQCEQRCCGGLSAICACVSGPWGPCSKQPPSSLHLEHDGGAAPPFEKAGAWREPSFKHVLHGRPMAHARQRPHAEEGFLLSGSGMVEAQDMDIGSAVFCRLWGLCAGGEEAGVEGQLRWQLLYHSLASKILCACMVSTSTRLPSNAHGDAV